jgi:ParB family chromosome partitioning protein
MMAEKLGKSRSSITETLSLTQMPEEVREMCRLADIHSKSLLLQVVRQGAPDKMLALLSRLPKQGSTRDDARKLAREGKPSKGRPKHYVFQFRRDKAFNLSLQFKKSQVERDEIIQALESILQELRAQS